MTIKFIITVLFLGATFIQICYWCFLFSRFALYQEREDQESPRDEIPISIIICAKNECENLKKNLPLILNQNYRSLEVIVVNDSSTDDSGKVLLDFKQKNDYLRIINFNNTNKSHVGKKFALAEGIKAARYETLLLTDADCYPTSKDWVYKMQKSVRDNIEIGLGYGPYEKASGFLNIFVRYETVYTAIQYFTFALIGQTYMGVGRNLLYKRSLFFQTKGFTKHEHVASGDDDLFINEVARGNNVRITLDEATFMYSAPKKTWKSFYRQKARHMTTGGMYQRKHQLLLGLLSASHFLHYWGGIVLILFFSTMFAGVIYMVRILILLFWYTFILKKLKAVSLLKWIPILDAFHVVYYLVFLPKLFIGKKNTWT